jgi:hypothetical protein
MADRVTWHGAQNTTGKLYAYWEVPGDTEPEISFELVEQTSFIRTKTHKEHTLHL